MGYTDVALKTIYIDNRLPLREFRCTLMHEVLHAIRGDTDDDPAAEAWVQAETARRLLPVEALALALDWSIHPEDLCDTLDVDLDVFQHRLRTLDHDEAALIRRVLMSAMRAHPASTAAVATGLCVLSRWWRHNQQPEPLPCGHATCSRPNLTAIVA
jgi:hypothetical protein